MFRFQQYAFSFDRLIIVEDTQCMLSCIHGDQIESNAETFDRSFEQNTLGNYEDQFLFDL